MITQAFQAETQQILDLVIHSLYSHKEIFLRELISNASDAINKIRFDALTNPTLAAHGDFKIRLSVDRENRSLTVSDNGIGMSRDNLVTHLGTIAKSGTRDFLHKAKETSAIASDELIGKFGVGFYSSFMVAESITVISKKAGESQAYRWVSSGGDGYSIEETERTEHGTDVILQLKASEAEDESAQDFSDTSLIKHIVKKYSDFIAYPIVMSEGGKEEILNSMKAIWTKRKNDVTAEEYTEFYKQFTHDWNTPAEIIHVTAEGTAEYCALLFIPEKAPFSVFQTEQKQNLSLYVRRVFIMDHCKDLLPDYLRFVRGLVDSADLSLNVSREILQQDRQLKIISKHLVKKILDTLAEMKKNNFEKYSAFCGEFGVFMKEGFHTDVANKDKLVDLLLFPSSHDKTKPTSLEEYVWRMPKEQTEIYTVSGESVALVEYSPHLEQVKAKGFEVLYFVDPIDEWVAMGLTDYKHKKIKSLNKGALDLDSEKEENGEKESEKQYQELLKKIKEHLEDKVSDVRLSNRLNQSAACLVADRDGMTSNLERILKKSGQGEKLGAGLHKRILELNPRHELLALLEQRFEKDKKDPVIADYSELLYTQALVADGEPIPNPAQFAKQLNKLMMKAGVAAQ